jgi:hypothetical protein
MFSQIRAIVVMQSAKGEGAFILTVKLQGGQQNDGYSIRYQSKFTNLHTLFRPPVRFGRSFTLSVSPRHLKELGIFQRLAVSTRNSNAAGVLVTAFTLAWDLLVAAITS